MLASAERGDEHEDNVCVELEVDADCQCNCEMDGVVHGVVDERQSAQDSSQLVQGVRGRQGG